MAGRLVGGAVGLPLVVVCVAACGGGVTPSTPDVAPMSVPASTAASVSPTSSKAPATTTTSATSTAPTTAASTAGLALGKTATFAHFTVTVTGTQVSEAHGLLIAAKVCVTSLPPNPTGDKTRISWDPWKVATGGVATAASIFDASHPPNNLFPQTGLYAAGQCVEGNIPFSTLLLKPAEVRYANQLGDTASWKVPAA